MANKYIYTNSFISGDHLAFLFGLEQAFEMSGFLEKFINEKKGFLTVKKVETITNSRTILATIAHQSIS